MKSFLVLASLASIVLGQRLRIQEPTSGQTFPSGSLITVEVSDATPATPVTQGNIIIAITPCFDGCDQPDQWSTSAVLYDGPLNVQDNPANFTKGRYEDFNLTLPQFQPGEAVLSVSHKFLSESASGPFPLYEYTNVHINLQ